MQIDTKLRIAEVWCLKSIAVFDLIELILHYAHVLPKISNLIHRKTLSQCVRDIIDCRYHVEDDFL